MVTTACKDTTEVESKVNSVAKTDVVQETKTHCKLLVHEVLSVIATVISHKETSVTVRNYVPKASLLVSTDSMRDVPHYISVKVCKAELLLEHILALIESKTKNR